MAQGTIEPPGGPWTIKYIDTAAKEAIIEAARLAKMNIGQWISMAAAEKIQGVSAGDVGPVHNGSDKPSAPTFASSAEAVALAVQLASVPKENDSAMLGTARQAVRNFLLSQKTSGTGRGKQAQLPAPDA